MPARRLQTTPIRLLEPDLCEACPFAEISTRKDSSGASVRKIKCHRKDCDNWESMSITEVAMLIEDLGLCREH